MSLPNTSTWSEAGQPDDGEMTVGGEEPPSSDIDTPALSAVSSGVSNDGDNDIDTPALSTVSSGVSNDGDGEIGSTDCKRKLPISLPGKGKTVHKFPRTANRQAWPNNPERIHRNGRDECNSSGTLGNTTDTATTNAHTSLSRSVIGDHLIANHETYSGTSQLALASRRLRKEVASGAYVVKRKRFENWREKLSNLDKDAQVDDKNPRKVFHSRCSTWIFVKEPGDTTRFKVHIGTCQAKPIPTDGTLMGMGWLKLGKKAGMSNDSKHRAKGSGKGEVKMPCRGVSDMDDQLVDHYLNRMGAGGGGGRSIHVILMGRFGGKFRYLTRSQKEVVQEVQRAEWAWRNDYLNLRIYATNCERFTSSHSLALSLCAKCNRLLVLKAFTNVIHRKTSLDENLKYTNAKYLNPVLGCLYRRVKGLWMIIEQPVSNIQ